MNTICFTLAVRQRICQNGISRRTDNVYTNISPNAVIPLNFGYSLTFITGTADCAQIQLSNPDKIPNLIFNIPSGNYKIFDLPTENGTLRVFVSATSIECEKTVVCCTM